MEQILNFLMKDFAKRYFWAGKVIENMFWNKCRSYGTTVASVIKMLFFVSQSAHENVNKSICCYYKAIIYSFPKLS
jgi:hypothetical protein